MEDNAVFIPAMSDNNRNVGQVEGRCSDVEDSSDGEGRANADQVETTAEDDHQPHGVNGCVGVGVYLGPEAGMS